MPRIYYGVHYLLTDWLNLLNILEYYMKLNTNDWIFCAILPFASQVSLSTGNQRVSSQHFKGAGFACAIHTQQTEALKEGRDMILA